MTLHVCMIVTLPLGFRAKASVTDDGERIESPARNAGLWSVQGARKLCFQGEMTMTEQHCQPLKTDHAKPRTPKPAGRTKSDEMCKLLSSRSGATVAQLQRQLDWQPHRIRAAISRLRSAGVAIELDRSGKVARYRIAFGGS